MGEIMNNRTAYDFSLSRAVFFAVVAFASLTAVIGVERMNATARQTEAQATRLEFEVAAVRPLLAVRPVPAGIPNPAARFACRGADGMVSQEGALSSATVPEGRCVGDIALPQLIALAYGVQRRYVSGGPDWMRQQPFQLYQINAQAADPAKATADHLKQMLQSLLADRFQLAFHREKQQSQEYVLRVARNGPKFKAVSGSEEAPRIIPSDIGQPNITIRGKSEIGKFATFLASFVGFPVVDKTAIAGMHEYLLRLNIVPGQRGGGVGVRGGGGGTGTISVTEFDPPVSIALQEQLGLRLDQEDVTVEMIVIDRAEKPSEN